MSSPVLFWRGGGVDSAAIDQGRSSNCVHDLVWVFGLYKHSKPLLSDKCCKERLRRGWGEEELNYFISFRHVVFTLNSYLLSYIPICKTKWKYSVNGCPLRKNIDVFSMRYIGSMHRCLPMYQLETRCFFFKSSIFSNITSQSL